MKKQTLLHSIKTVTEKTLVEEREVGTPNKLRNWVKIGKKLWSKPEKSILRAAVASYGVYAEYSRRSNVVNLLTVPWHAVAEHLPGRHPTECLVQWRLLFPNSVLKKAGNGILYISTKPILLPHNCSCPVSMASESLSIGNKRKTYCGSDGSFNRSSSSSGSDNTYDYKHQNKKHKSKA